MDSNEAAAALARVEHTRNRLAERAHWPFHRHAMFGLGEALLVTSLAQPVALALPMTGVALALFAVCVVDDRRRHGMFVSGWQAGNTRPLTIALAVFVALMGVGSAMVRDGASAQPLGYLIGLATFIGCTAASLAWERIYRAQLSTRAGR